MGGGCGCVAGNLMLPVQHFQNRTTCRRVGHLEAQVRPRFYGTIHEWNRRQDVRNNKPESLSATSKR
jgi:hypothetical protein